MRWSWATALILTAGCGIPAPSESTTVTGDTEVDVPTDGLDDDDDGEPTIGLDTDGLDTDGLDTDGGDVLCQLEIAALTPLVTEPEGGCSVIVRLDHDTLEVLGYRSFCAPYRDLWLDEQAARDLTECCSMAGTVLNLPSETELWVFYVTPGDFGDVAVVSNHVVQRVFEASIVWDGMGEIVFPGVWTEPGALGSDCGTTPMPDSLRSYDLVEGGTIAEDDLGEVWTVVGSSALPFAMNEQGRPLRAAVLRYPRTVGVFDPTTAEYVVVLEGGIPREDPTTDATSWR